MRKVSFLVNQNRYVLTTFFVMRKRDAFDNQGGHYMLFVIYRMFVIRKIAKNGGTACSKNNE